MKRSGNYFLCREINVITLASVPWWNLPYQGNFPPADYFSWL